MQEDAFTATSIPLVSVETRTFFQLAHTQHIYLTAGLVHYIIIIIIITVYSFPWPAELEPSRGICYWNGFQLTLRQSPELS